MAGAEFRFTHTWKPRSVEGHLKVGAGWYLAEKVQKWGKCIISKFHLGVSKNNGTPTWMVKIMENPIKLDDLGVPLFSETSACLWCQILSVFFGFGAEKREEEVCFLVG